MISEDLSQVFITQIESGGVVMIGMHDRDVMIGQALGLALVAGTPVLISCVVDLTLVVS